MLILCRIKSFIIYNKLLYSSKQAIVINSCVASKSRLNKYKRLGKTPFLKNNMKIVPFKWRSPSPAFRHILHSFCCGIHYRIYMLFMVHLKAQLQLFKYNRHLQDNQIHHQRYHAHLQLFIYILFNLHQYFRFPQQSKLTTYYRIEWIQ